MVKIVGCGKPAPGSSSPEFGFLSLRELKGPGYHYKSGYVLEGGYSNPTLGNNCGDLWGYDPFFWQLVCVDCLKRTGYIW